MILVRRHATKFISDRSVKEKIVIWFIKDHFKAIQFRIFNLTLKLLSCILYIVQAILDPRPNKVSSRQVLHLNSNSKLTLFIILAFQSSTF